MAQITNHGKKRMYQRAGITKGSADKMAKKILQNGFTHAETRGSLNHFLYRKWKDHHFANNMRVYGNQLYIFRNESLIAVLMIPEPIMQDMKRNLTEAAYEKYQQRRESKGKARLAA